MGDMENWPRVDENDPERCGGSTGNGQCWLKRVDNSEYCPVHGGGHQLRKNKQARTAEWKLGRFEKSIKDKGSSAAMHTMQVAIGTLCTTLELSVARCQEDADLVLKSGPINQMAMNLGKLLSDAQQMAMRMGQVMNKTEAMAMAQSIVTIISEEVTDSVVLERIIDRIEDLMEHQDADSDPAG